MADNSLLFTWIRTVSLYQNIWVEAIASRRFPLTSIPCSRWLFLAKVRLHRRSRRMNRPLPRYFLGCEMLIKSARPRKVTASVCSI